MIQAVMKIGKWTQKRSENTDPLNNFVQNPNEKGNIQKVITISLVQQDNVWIYKDAEIEEFKEKYIPKYLYRFLVPTLCVNAARTLRALAVPVLCVPAFQTFQDAERPDCVPTQSVTAIKLRNIRSAEHTVWQPRAIAKRYVRHSSALNLTAVTRSVGTRFRGDLECHSFSLNKD